MIADAPPRPTDLTPWRRSGRADVWPDEIPGVGMHREVFLTAKRSSVHQARVFTVATLADWRLPGLFDDVSLCVSELVTNGVRYTADDSMVRLTLHMFGSRCLWVHVADSDPHPPVPRPQVGEEGTPDWDDMDLLSESGRGLYMVGKLSSGWNWTPVTDGTAGKVVSCWFECERA